MKPNNMTWDEISYIWDYENDDYLHESQHLA